ncbi:hypothetical protein GCM10027442_29990 [Emticicia fontis]
MLVFVPFSKILPLLGTQVTIQEKVDASRNEYKYLRRAIRRACRYSFWRTRCFEQALCAKLMLKLRRTGSTIYFGVKKDKPDTELQAHAWLICNQEIITGGENSNEFVVISSFSS